MYRLNKDFYGRLPGYACSILEALINKYGKEPWFKEAWEKYREHVNNASKEEVKMPGFIFNRYLKEGNIYG